MERKVGIGLVVAEFNWDITSEMLEKTKKYAQKAGAHIRYVCFVPGSFDMPLMIKTLLERDDVDAVVTLGAIVKGETLHDELIAHQVARKITDLALEYGKPVSLGVSGPGMTREQGVARTEDYARRSVEAAVKMARRLSALHETKPAEYPVEVK